MIKRLLGRVLFRVATLSAMPFQVQDENAEKRADALAKETIRDKKSLK